MRGLKVSLVALLLVTAIALRAGSVAKSQNNTVTCDSDLMLNWYLAERYFAFGAVHNSLAQTAIDRTTVLDLNRFNRGEFAPLFDAVRSAQDPNTRTLPGVTLTQEWLNPVLATMLMDDNSFRDFLNSIQGANAGTPLTSASVAGEAPECTQLRQQLRRFFAAVTVLDLQTGFTPGVNVNVNANINANINSNINANTNDNAANTNTNANTNVNGNTNTNTNDNVGGNNNNNDNDDDDDDDNSGSGNSGSGGDNDNDDNSGGGNGGSGGGDDDDD